MAMTKSEKAEMERLARQRDDAVDQLREYLDDQTPSDFWNDDLFYDKTSKTFRRRFIQTQSVTLGFDGFEVSMHRTSDDEVFIRFNIRSGSLHAVIIPQATNAIKIVRVTRDHIKRLKDEET